MSATASCALPQPSSLAPHAVGRCAGREVGRATGPRLASTPQSSWRGSEVPGPCASREAQRTALIGLDLRAGESYEVMDDGLKHAGWRKVRSLDGTRTGYVPGNYIEAEVGTSLSGLHVRLCPQVSGPALLTHARSLLAIAQSAGRVFGEALPAIMARKSEQGRDVPRFVDDIVDRMLQLGGSTTVGIFRWPGADQEVKAICTAYVTQRRELPPIASH